MNLTFFEMTVFSFIRARQCAIHLVSVAAAVVVVNEERKREICSSSMCRRRHPVV